MEINKLKGLRRNLVLLALVELIGGLFLIIYNSQGLEMLLRIIGIIAAAYGVITLVVAVTASFLARSVRSLWC